MINSSVLRNIFFIVILHLCGKAFCQDTIFRLNRHGLVGVIKKENDTIGVYTRIQLNHNVSLLKSSIIKGDSSGATGILDTNIFNSSSLNLIMVKGVFLKNETLSINGISNGKTIKKVCQIVQISVFEGGDIKSKSIRKDKIFAIKKGRGDNYFVLDNLGNVDKKAMKTKLKMNWIVFRRKEKKIPDTLALIDRHPLTKIFVGIKKDSVDGNFLYYRKPGRTKVKSMELEKIYSVNYSTKRPPLILYVQDTLEGNWYTAEQMADYMRGQNDAYRNYKKKARLSALNGFLVGIASPAIDDRFGPFIIVGYTGLVGFSKPKLKTRYGFDANYKDNPYYEEGFGTMAKRLTLWHAATATVSGYVLGSIGLLFLVN